MPIRQMVSKERFEANPAAIEVVTGFPGHPEALYMETSHVGCVIETRERNGYDDSDFYAIVWDAANGMPKEVEYATTRGWSYPNNAVVDATPEVLAAYKAYRDARHAEAEARHAAELAKLPKVGVKVRVTGGRKLPKGTEAEITWVGKDAYKEAQASRYAKHLSGFETFRYDPSEWRLGVRLIDGSRVFLSAKNVELI